MTATTLTCAQVAQDTCCLLRELFLLGSGKNTACNVLAFVSAFFLET